MVFVTVGRILFPVGHARLMFKRTTSDDGLRTFEAFGN